MLFASIDDLFYMKKKTSQILHLKRSFKNSITHNFLLPMIYPNLRNLKQYTSSSSSSKKGQHDGNQVYNNIIAKLLHPLRESFSPKAERKIKWAKKKVAIVVLPKASGILEAKKKKRSSKMSIMGWVSCRYFFSSHSPAAEN